MSILKLSTVEVTQFLGRRPFSVIHLDAAWDGYRKPVEANMLQAMSAYSEQVSFGYVDVDENADYANLVRLSNVPACAYFRGNELIGIVIGLKQNIAANIAIILAGGSLDTTNTISRF